MRLSARKKNIFLRVALVALAVYIVAALIQLQLQLNDGQKQLDALNGQYYLAQGMLADLSEQMDNKDLYQEQQAREQGMSQSGESVYYVIPSEE